MKDNNLYVFDSIHTVARYLHSLSHVLSPMKLQKSLYFLFAYYGAFYADKEKEGISEKTDSTYLYLFKGEFEAWSYGSVNREVYLESKNEDYFSENKVEEAIKKVNENREVKQYIDELFEQINSVSDFTLAFRNKQDESWIDTYEKGKMNVISNEKLIQEYRERYL